MIIKAIAMAGGLAGAVGLSQFPEYSQQYTQRLSGAVEELSAVVAQFDADAAGLGLSREAALRDLRQGSRMGEARAISMGHVLARHQRLSADLAAITDSTPLAKLLNAGRFTDVDLARKAWADFKPAVPVTGEGLGLAGLGFVAGYGLLAGLIGGLSRLGRRRRASAA
ncbi:DUF2937 family protein [Roseovarius sp. PS-C2]|uniref:DUF2937 family protein n=1 Tax=Roseovarius sp. PS-C2 TaxID=2820814 RepID=UPI001C0C6117|nr:DUF2937 family protein [Roseovarius sp. PS-C2]MBU3258607.1 DUF2937 family protein [Roseovarius sp. PS-C2]